MRIERPGAGGAMSPHAAMSGSGFFQDDADRHHFLELLAETVQRFRVRLHCFVLMDHHYHLLLALTEPNLSRAVQWLNVSYSIWFNRRRQRSGHFFQGGLNRSLSPLARLDTCEP